MIFGIILDTFATLRDSNAEKEEDMKNYCFTCSLHRDKLDKINGGFEYHLKKEVN